MSRPQKVREVYAELKSIMGKTMSRSDLLECAWLIIRSADGHDIRPRYDLRTGPTPFEELWTFCLTGAAGGWSAMSTSLTSRIRQTSAPRRSWTNFCSSPPRRIAQRSKRTLKCETTTG